jgi:hypothetical protein
MRRWSSVLAGAPQRPFVPGDYTVERILIGAPPPEDSDVEVTQLKPGFTFGEETYPTYRASAPFWFQKGDWAEMCKVETAMRQRCWAPEQVFAPDSCTFTLPSALAADFKPSEKHPFVTDAQGALEMLAVCHPDDTLSIPGEGSCSGDYAAVRFDNWPRYRKYPKLPFRLSSIPAGARTGVLVAGGGTGGAPAAVGAARSSARVICLEAACHLGGLTTQGRIGSYWFGNRRGYSCELDRNVAEMGENTQYPATGRKWDIEWKQHHFLRAALRGGVEVCPAVRCLRRSERRENVHHRSDPQPK